ncbi:MAG: efflux RND transporter periplasmic adaptor subunit [bacterium]
MLSKKISWGVPPLFVLLLIYSGGGCGKKGQGPGNAIVNRIDEDRDGSFGRFDLRIDANGQTEEDTLSVKARIISAATSDTIWSDVWQLKGKSTDDAHTVSLSSEDFHLTGPTKIALKIELYDSTGIHRFDADSTLRILVDDDDSNPQFRAEFGEQSPSIVNTTDLNNDRYVEKFDLRIDADASSPKAEVDVKAKIISRTTGDTIWTDSWQVKGRSEKDAYTKTLRADEFTLSDRKKLPLTVELYDSTGQVRFEVDSSLAVQVDYDTSSMPQAAFKREERPQGDELPPVPVETTKAKRGDVSSHLVATATLEPERRADVVAKVSGLVEKIFVEEGHRVREGDVLARLDDERLKIQVEQALAELNRLQADFKRAGDLFAKELISEEEYENIQFQWESQKSVYELARLDLKYSSITAPISGVITERLIRIGNQVNANQKVFAVANFDPLVAVVFIPESKMRRLKVGQPVKILIDADGDELHQGRVARISPVVDPTSGTVKATIEVGGSRDSLKPGMFCRLKIITETRTDAVVIPKRALVSDDGEQAVFVVANNLARKRMVEVGFDDEDRVEILSGLEEGEQVITIGQSGLKDSTKVEIIELP